MSSFERFKKIEEMAEMHNFEQLMQMWSMSMIEGGYWDTSIEIAFAIIINRQNYFNKQIEEIKQCLNDKQDKFKIEKNVDPFSGLTQHSILIEGEKKDE